MDYLYVMDYSDCSICEIDISNEDLVNEDLENILKQYGLNIDTCAYMYSQIKINNIETLEKL